MPRPGTFDNRRDRLELWLPAEFPLDLVGGCDQARRVARTSWLFHHGDLFAGHRLTGGDDFADAGAAAGAEVVEGALIRAEGQHVGLGEVYDVDVVADAGAVGRLVIGPENLDILLL